MKRILTCLIAAALAGCNTVVIPKVEHAVVCTPPAAMLETCAGPADIKQGITFGELIDVSGRDRDTLKQCALTHRRLSETVADCNKRLADYNASLDEFNKNYTGKR
jgi:hypothetical protein